MQHHGQEEDLYQVDQEVGLFQEGQAGHSDRAAEVPYRAVVALSPLQEEVGGL